MLAPWTHAVWTQDARRVDPRHTQSGHTQDTPRVDAGAVDEGRMQTQWQVISWSTVLMPLKGLITRSYTLAGIFKGKRVMQFLIKNGYNNKLTTSCSPLVKAKEVHTTFNPSASKPIPGLLNFL